MRPKFEDVLNECVELVTAGETIEACLNRYPAYAKELAPLLQVARATSEAAAGLEPRPGFKAEALYRLSREVPKASARRRHWFWGLYPLAKPLVIGLVLALLLTAAAGGTTVAAEGSVPGEPLYLVKRMKERVLLLIPRSDVSKARLEVALAQKRSDELVKLARRGRWEKVANMAQHMEKHLNRAASAVVGKPPGAQRAPVAVGHPPHPYPDTKRLREQVKENLRTHRASLEGVLKRVPPGARPFLMRAMTTSEGVYKAAIGALGEAQGVVLGFDPSSGVMLLKTESGEQIRLAISGDTEVKVGGREASPGLLKPGSNVQAEWDPETLEVKEIEVLRGR